MKEVITKNSKGLIIVFNITGFSLNKEEYEIAQGIQNALNYEPKYP